MLSGFQSDSYYMNKMDDATTFARSKLIQKTNIDLVYYEKI